MGDIEPVSGVLDAIEDNAKKGGGILVAGLGISKYATELTRRGFQVETAATPETERDRARALRRSEDAEATMEAGGHRVEIFDCVLSVGILSGSARPEMVVRDWHSRLAPSGLLVLVESQRRFGGVAARAAPCDRADVTGSNGWSPEELRKLVEPEGFRMNSMSRGHGPNADSVVTAVKARHYLEVGGYRFMSAETAEDLDRVWRLRYEVYCEELRVEPDNRSGIMRDEFDDYSTQLLAVDGSNQTVGILRVVADGPKGLPIEADYPLREYMEAHGISKAAEGGRFAIGTGVAREDRGMVAFGLFKLLVDCCRRSGTNDLFHTTHLGIFGKYEMPGFTQIGESFEYPGALAGVQWVPVHCDLDRAYEKYLGGLSAGD
jgi:N-acyl-L-homoserine lactone synthetase